MATKDLLNPNNSPGSSTERLGKKPLVIIIIGVVIFFIMVMIVISSSSENIKPPETKFVNNNDDSSSADDIIKGRSGLIASPEIKEETIIKPKDLDNPPKPPEVPNNQNLNTDFVGTVPDDPMANIRRDMQNKALLSRTAIDFRAATGVQGSGSVEDYEAQVQALRNTGDAGAVYQARLKQVQAMQQGQMNANDINALSSPSSSSAGMFGGGYPGAEGSSQPVSYNQFDGKSNRWDLGNKREASLPYELKTGFVIPATLITGINSEIRGHVQAQVSQNVYDTATGKHLLIPQGSRLIGEYSNAIMYGQNRIMIAWQRIVFPDSTTLDLGAMIGADQAGYSGFEDKVNHHYIRTFASALMMSGIVAGINLSQDNNNDDNSNKQRSSDALSEALGNQLGQVTMQMINKNLNISPTITIRPGYRFNVIVTKDIKFNAPYSAQIPR